MNKQRQVIYNQRARILRNEGIREEVLDMLDDLLETAVTFVCDERIKPIEWDLDKLKERFKFLTSRDLELPSDLAIERQAIFDFLREQAHSIYKAHADQQSAKLQGLTEIGVAPQINRGLMGRDTPVGFEVIEQDTMLEAVDYFWRHHLQEMDHLREGIGLRGYAQKNPLYEYQKEGFVLFQQMLEEMKESVIRRLYYHDVPSVEEVVQHLEEERKRREAMEKQMQLVHGGGEEEEESAEEQAENSKLPDDERARLEAQKKARRKAARK
jgi:preprotein translocase subunit SecA